LCFVALIAALAVARTRPLLVDRYRRLHEASDFYPLPSPEQTVVLSLGYRAALADLLFAHVLVSYGLHFQDKRRFDFVGRYIDTMNALDPIFVEPYRFADTLLVISPKAPRLEDYVKAKDILERGIANLPYDTELWLVAGQYMAYVARPHLPDEAMKARWGKRGAELLARACELASENEAIPYHCISAARLFHKAGEREAAIRSLERLLAVTDDPEIERLALGYLAKHLSEREEERQQTRRQAFRERWGKDLAFASKDLLLVLGPDFDTSRCAGPEHAKQPECATSWRDWAQQIDGNER
jgi:tetratricopeptide (TPR) repeat protein